MMLRTAETSNVELLGTAPPAWRSSAVAGPVSTRVACGLLAPVDALIIVGASVVAYTIWLLDAEHEVIWADYVFASLFAALLAVNIFNLVGLYDFKILNRLTVTLRRLVSSLGAVAILLLMISFLTKSSADYSRAWSILWFTITLFSLIGARCVFYFKVRGWAAEGRLYRNVAIVGGGEIGQHLRDYFSSDTSAAVRIVGMFDDRTNVRTDEDRYYPVEGDLDALVAFARGHPLDTIIVALPLSADRRLAQIFERLKVLPVDIRLFPGPIAFHLRDAATGDHGELPLLKVLDRPLVDWRFALKELEDRVLAAIILMLISPVLLAIAVAIKLDSPGPALFRQKRYGYNNQLIEVLKFRTMYHAQRDLDGTQLTQRDDPRITRLGAFLRRTSLDELPQFLNVLRGEMSIVGPRPHALSAKAGGILYHDAVKNYPARHRVKPGITGWAQVNGWRGETEKLYQIRNRVEHDLHYIENWSIWLDLKIIILTIVKGFSGRNVF